MKNKIVKKRNIYNYFAWSAILCLYSLIVSCSSSNHTNPIPASLNVGNSFSSRCVAASSEQIAAIQDGVDDIAKDNYIKTGYAVKSNSFENVWMVAAKIYGPGMGNGTGPGVWAISGSGMVLSVNGTAKSFSPLPDASKTDAAITAGDDGVSEAEQCANDE
jgi:hypothetical protein